MKDFRELEIYAPIEGFPDYLVTSWGRVLSLKDSHGKDRIKELKPCKGKGGYMHAVLHKNGKQYNKYVHRLVAQAFIINDDNKPCINHIDENKTNNHVSNLEWCTYKENNNHGTRNERVSKAHIGNKNHMYGKKHTEESKQKMSEHRKGKTNGINHPKAKPVIGFKINGCNIKYYKYIGECKKDGFATQHVVECCKGKRKSHKGFEWFYVDEFFNRKDDKQ